MEEDEWERDCRLQAEFHDDNQTARASISNATPGPPPNFVAAKKFSGKRKEENDLKNKTLENISIALFGMAEQG